MKLSTFSYPYEQAATSGFHGRILQVDLSSGKMWLDEPREEFYRTLVGGRAVIAYYLLKETPANIDPLSPDNLLIFAPGILTGTSLPGSGRHGIGAKSPLTGAIASAEAGGWWGAELKRAGLDGLVIRGRASAPVFLSIMNGEAGLHPAGHLWGKTTAETEALLHEELGDHKIRVAGIGPAGENLVRFAAIMHDVNRAAGRAGLGAVMGSKNLKAIVVRGKYPVNLADKARVMEVSRWLAENYKVLSKWRIDMGTPATILNLQRVGALPTRNFQEPLFEHAEAISGERMHATVLIDRDTCSVCPIRCKQVVKIDGGADGEVYEVDPVYGGPEFETMAAFGSNCGVGDLGAICKANELCNAYGLDTISTGSTIAFVMECFQRGLLTEADTGGDRIEFGDARAMLQAILQIAHQEGFGREMALGSAELARRIGRGAEDLVMAVKKLETAYHDPRLKFALGLGYTVAPVGADHMMNVHDPNYLENGAGLGRVKALGINEPLPLKSLDERKVQVFYHEVNWQHFQDCAVTCMFFPYQYHHLAQALSGATGWDIDIYDVLRVGERANTLCRLYNLREGLTSEQDRLPKRFYQAYGSGPLSGVAPDPEQMETARRTYYELMGWDRESGIPKMERLVELGLPWAVEIAEVDAI
jgi:aldehyde:ferredoxin oxidoreductase